MADEPSEDEVVDQQDELADDLSDGGRESELSKEEAQEGPGSTAGGGVP